MKNKLMCHVVAGYPSEKECVDLMLGMQKAGIRTIEVQIPFSDPIADGETIMIANDKALASGMTTQKSFDLIKTARKSGLEADIYIMSYSQKLISFGTASFCEQAKSVGVKGLIIPDLPIEAEEYSVLKKQTDLYNMEIVPVVSPGAEKERLKNSLDSAGSLIYLTTVKGITGNKLRLNKSLEQIAKEIKKQRPDAKLAIGFGVQTKEDIREVLDIADIAVVGSAAIRHIDKGGVKEGLRFLQGL